MIDDYRASAPAPPADRTTVERVKQQFDFAVPRPCTEHPAPPSSQPQQKTQPEVHNVGDDDETTQAPEVTATQKVEADSQDTIAPDDVDEEDGEVEEDVDETGAATSHGGGASAGDGSVAGGHQTELSLGVDATGKQDVHVVDSVVSADRPTGDV